MAGEAQNSEVILRQARQSLTNQRAGGRRVVSIGRRSAALKRQHLKKKLARIGLALVGVYFAATVAGLVLDGIGWTGVIVTLLASVIAVGLFGSYPGLPVPSRESLRGSDVKSLVGRTELWLEQQRPALPAPAVQLVDTIGLQLDALGSQLDGLTDNAPAALEVRMLVGDHLPRTDFLLHLDSTPPARRGAERRQP